MHRRIRFSGEHQTLSEIATQHADLAAALKMYYRSRLPMRFAGYSPQELSLELELRLAELSRMSALNVISAIEAAFRMDYLQRCYQRKKDPVSKAFRALYEASGHRARLEDGILGVWQKNATVPPSIMEDLKAVLRYRHWLAHGRYWTPRLGRKHDYESVFQLAHAVLAGFPFLR